MEDLAAMRLGERFRHREGDAQGVLQGGVRDPLVERLSLDVFEREIRPARVTAGRVDRDDMRMAELRCRARLREEGGFIRAQAADQLHRDAATQLRIAAEIHLAHRAAAQRPDDLEVIDHSAAIEQTAVIISYGRRDS